MQSTTQAVQIAIEELAKLPGIGRKTAQRLVFFLLKRSEGQIEALSRSLINLKKTVHFCEICFNITETSPCAICTSHNRNHKQICVVEEPNDVYAIERTNEYRGLYHVLGGCLSPLDGVGPDQLKIRELLQRLEKGVEEVILATNANAEGEATAIYLNKLMQSFGLQITRIARGIPMGGDLEYADEMTLSRALSERVKM
ncbi:MAG: recombination protein RecR [Deferribacteres bacterium]|nr:recombination protein RecR [candidate division KSB1 bacterium]MCB9511777.1 recombination protein RecR [Deferribacteres bacterium]